MSFTPNSTQEDDRYWLHDPAKDANDAACRDAMADEDNGDEDEEDAWISTDLKIDQNNTATL